MAPVFDPRVFDTKSHETGDEAKPGAEQKERAKQEEEAAGEGTVKGAGANAKK